jgi:foldase protein PrsA
VNNRLAWGINIILVLIIIVLGVLLLGDKSITKHPVGSDVETGENSSINQLGEAVATVGDVNITEKEWVDALKELYGKEVLEQLINHEVVARLAEVNEISISEKELNRQMDFFQRQLLTTGEQSHLSPEALEEEIKYSILFEEIITNDIVISDEEVEMFYEENQDLFNLKEQFHLSHIIVEDLSTADQVQQELKDGGSFSTLAMELSTDMYTRTDGGELGWLEKGSSYLPEAYWNTLNKLEPDNNSEPIKVEEGYAIVYLHEVKPEKTYTFEDVKSQIRRQLAINQIQDTMSPIQFWNDIKVDWIYSTK